MNKNEPISANRAKHISKLNQNVNTKIKTFIFTIRDLQYEKLAFTIRAIIFFEFVSLIV